MDVIMPVDGRHCRATEAIRRELPDVEVLALTSVLDDGSVVGAVKSRAIGYLLKDTQAEELCRAIKGRGCRAGLAFTPGGCSFSA